MPHPSFLHFLFQPFFLNTIILLPLSTRTFYFSTLPLSWPKFSFLFNLFFRSIIVFLLTSCDCLKFDPNSTLLTCLLLSLLKGRFSFFSQPSLFRLSFSTTTCSCFFFSTHTLMTILSPSSTLLMLCFLSLNSMPWTQLLFMFFSSNCCYKSSFHFLTQTSLSHDGWNSF